MKVIHKQRAFPLSSLTIALACVLLGTYTVMVSASLDRTYIEVQRQLGSPRMSGSYGSVEIGKSTINVTSPLLSREKGVWSYSSSKALLSENFLPESLITSPVSYADDSGPMRIDPRISDALQGLVSAAKDQGIYLQISSAYRSINDQTELLDEVTLAQGAAYAQLYVAEPRASEHHTGLAVDFADKSDMCSADSDNCNLSQTTARWLAQNGPEFGFILRYPLGKESLTGINYEPWHYRYVGIALARVLTQEGITYDEFSERLRMNR